METTVKQRLISFIEFLGISKNAFETACGLSTRYVSNITNSVTPQKLKQISLKFPELNTAWLLTGDGEMLKPQPQVLQNNYNGNNNYVVGNGNNVQCSECGADVQMLEAEGVERAPILSATLARAPQINILKAVEDKGDELEKSPVGVFNAPVDIWYRVQDESLFPKYEIGDLLALWAYPKGDEDPIPGKLYGIHTLTNGLVIRKLFPAEDGYIARAVNKEDFPDYKVKATNVVHIYKIMLMVRF